MKHIALIASILAFAASADESAPRADSADSIEKTTVNATALLKDGSTVKGEFLTTGITGSTIFCDKLTLEPDIVKSLTFPSTNDAAHIELVNGDRFTIKVQDPAFVLNSMLGELTIPRKGLQSLALAQRRARAAGAEPGLLFHCTFDDEAAITSPAVGPKGTFLQGRFMPGKIGQALQTTVYSHNATFELPANFFHTSGCIEFWAKIQKPSPYIGNGGDPRLFTITQQSTHSTVCGLDIVSNNGCGNSGFSTGTLLGNMASIRGFRQLRYDELYPSSDYRDWHHYAIVWDPDGISSLTGTPKMALLVDGEQMPDIQKQIRSIEAAAAIISTPMLLSLTHDPQLDSEHTTKSPFLIDEFKIWDHAKTTFETAL